MNISIYNPFYVINRKGLPKFLYYFFAVTNKICLTGILVRFNLPLSREKDNKTLSFINSWISQFKLPKNLLYCCAYQKTKNDLRIPYDVWD